MTDINIVIAGVGGQGTVLAGCVIGRAALGCGLDVKVSEIHGMAQRGGSVVTFVKIGRNIFSPVIEENSADIVLAFEQLEASRSEKYLRKDGVMIINDQQIDPMPVAAGKAKYPENICETLSKKYHVASLNAHEIATNSGLAKAANIVMLGAVSAYLEFDDAAWFDALKNIIPEKYLDVNIKAFVAGKSESKGDLKHGILE
ncbi:MAG: indolepyruvate oxidoreductase subunit beta [Eubacteriales bacterium]|jgi:indolepyruvate ferredoxin oxidoreductase beta subunit|nr:indolepyruvate oxidoreductase subunit beta [Eubacteriales bacterium]